MSVTEIVSLACLFILFLTMFFVVKNHFVLMRLGQQRAEQDGAMMNVQDRTNSNSTANTPLQPRVGEMAPIGMHVMPHQRGVLIILSAFKSVPQFSSLCCSRARYFF